MPLTSAQQATLKADILARLSTDFAGYTGEYMDSQIADWYNIEDAGAFKVWRTNVNTDEIFNAITWANFTPVDTPDGTNLHLDRSMACQGKQFNLQTLLMGRQSINPMQTIRSGLQDALQNIPAGTGGALLGAGWAAVKVVLTRNATRIEKLLAVGAGTAATPATLGFEGLISGYECSNARVN